MSDRTIGASVGINTLIRLRYASFNGLELNIISIMNCIAPLLSLRVLMKNTLRNPDAHKL